MKTKIMEEILSISYGHEGKDAGFWPVSIGVSNPKVSAK